ncbi:lipid phosphate phosphatase 1 [Laetiporus sulphureus 93-53]|uniref:Lipid phosphate phosphatase 1 n=1 Tax=Laetiporus sulphureus 93-53 TaxID=1314785 RepID=A0A165EL57_9APHY|nr:lipid phosphate phosphatase 1 [Laetiporus sulphureus 93-53]KZT07287.1 lipid phosphate phosphatase 1 [Laetiporus sulphureus 93-53]
MASSWSDAWGTVRRAFGEDSLQWLDRSYVVDWSIASIAWIVAWILSGLPPFEREFSRSDPVIDHKHRSSQISGELNWSIALFVPLAVVMATSLYRRSAVDLHHGCLALLAGRGFSEVITEFLKNRVGRLRPDFLHRCKWDKDVKSCAGDLETVLDGRRSFPSGHSSTAFSGMMFLSLFIAGMTGAWCITHPAPARSFVASRLARFILSLLPLVFASWVAISRLEDNKHHKEDVIVGSLIGSACAIVCYLTYWPSPFTHGRNPSASVSASASRSAAHAPRLVYVDHDRDSARQQNGYDYELAGMVHENGVESV